MKRIATFCIALTMLTALVAAVGLAAEKGAGPRPAVPFTEGRSDLPSAAESMRGSIGLDKTLGEPVDFAAALLAGADYLRHGQADVTEDNAGNGTDGVDETPDDPDDGGWDWRLTDPAFTHSTAASPVNIYGATAQGALRAYLASGDDALLTTLTDAADAIAADPEIRSAADVIFLMNFNDLPAVPGTAYADSALAKYEGRMGVYGSATALAEYIRDARAGQGYTDGLLAWDIGAWAVAVQMLHERYPGQGYDQDADDIAEVLYQDSFADNPGYFDIVDDQGFDPTYTDKNFWYYNLGITGLIDAFRATGSHAAEIPGLVTLLLAGQHPDGGMDDSYGVNPDNEDWQATAYAALCLAALDQATYQTEISRMAYFLAATQDVSGGWVYDGGNHYPEIGGECTAALSYGVAADDILVDDDFASQADVDLYNAANGTSYVLGYDAFAGIQDAIDAASGTTINVLAGVYEEQVEITTDLTLTGAGVGATIIRSPVDMALGFSTGATTKYPVVYVHDTAGPTISGLTVDGAGRGNLNVQFVGVGFLNAGGTVTDAHITGVRDTPFSGAQHGVSVYAINGTGGPYVIALTDVLIDDIQKNAMALLGDGLTVDLDHVTAIGAGPTDVTAQNGIQISNGAGGTIDDCHVEGVHWLGDEWTASGILISGAAPVTVTGTTVDGAQTSGYLINGSAVFQGCDVVNPGGDGLIIYNTTMTKALPRRLPSPYDAELTSKAAAPDKALMTTVVSGCTLTGAGVTDMGGIVAYAYPGAVDIDITGSTVSGWDYGVFLYEYGGAVTGEAHGNEIRDNVTYGAWSNTAVPYDATGNWWGEASGPYHATLNPLGLGNEVSDNILFEPYSGAGELAVLPAGSGPLQCGDTATLAFHYTPDAYTPGLQGYEVTFQAGSAVTCGVADIEDAGSLVGLGDSDFFYPTDNGDGTFTVTGAILGPTPGLQAEADLFTVDFHAVATGVADVEILSIRFRDPNNDPIGAALAGATIEVDCTPPDPVTGIQAEPGHEKVVVSWTDPAGDVVTLEVWRGLWYDTTPGTSAYPEYDDLPGDVIPTRPASRAAADASAEWELAGTVAAGAETYTDGLAPRGVYYYEVFPVDAAGNYGPPAAANDRATNYWLGDVYPAGSYDGVVDGGDITVLGACFATSDGEVGYDDECDVGPTDTNGPRGIPETDSTIDLEDLMMFALNYSVVGPAKALPPASGPLALGWIRLDDTRWALRLPAGFPQLKGLRLTAPLPEGISARVASGSLADEQPTPVFLYSSDRGGLEVDLAVMGTGVGFAGTGDLFVVDLSAPADLAQVEIEARDLGNESLRVELGLTAETPETKVFHLAQNSPNPFNPSTKIVFSLGEARNVRLTVYGLDGRLVRTLVAEPRAAGRHEVIWYGRDDSGRTVASGTYVYRIEAGDWVRTGKMVLAK